MGYLRRIWLSLDYLVWEWFASLMTAAAILIVLCEIIAKIVLPPPIANWLAAIKRALYRY